jgi:hypothetical protein
MSEDVRTRFYRNARSNPKELRRFLNSRCATLTEDGVWLDGIHEDPLGDIEIYNLQREFIGLDPV